MTGTLSTKGMMLAKRLKEKRRMEKSRNPNPKTPKMMGNAKSKKEKNSKMLKRMNEKKDLLYKNQRFKKLKG